MQKIRNTSTMNIGGNLRRLRLFNNYTQEKVTLKILTGYGIDVSREKYARYETGELNVPINFLVALQKLYGCSYNEFFVGLDVIEL